MLNIPYSSFFFFILEGVHYLLFFCPLWLTFSHGSTIHFCCSCCCCCCCWGILRSSRLWCPSAYTTTSFNRHGLHPIGRNELDIKYDDGKIGISISKKRFFLYYSPFFFLTRTASSSTLIRTRIRLTIFRLVCCETRRWLASVRYLTRQTQQP